MAELYERCSEEERNAALARLRAFLDEMAKAGITEEEVTAALAEAEAEARAEASQASDQQGTAPRPTSASTRAR